MSFIQKDFIKFSIFIAACGVALYWILTPYRQQRLWDAQLPEGRDKFTFLYGQLTNQTKVVVLGEYHESRDIALSFSFNLIMKLLYNMTVVTPAFFQTTHPINIYFEETVSTLPEVNRVMLCEKNGESTAPLCRLSKSVTSWDKYELHMASRDLIIAKRRMQIWNAAVSFQEKNALSDEAMYTLLRNSKHPQFLSLLRGIMNMVEMTRVDDKEVFIRDSFAYLFSMGERKSLKMVIEQLFAKAAQYHANITMRAGEKVESLIDRMLKSELARKRYVGRNDHLFGLINNASLRKNPSLFLAGNFHAFEMRDRLMKNPNDRVAVVSMKELTDEHHEHKRQFKLNRAALT